MFVSFIQYFCLLCLWFTSVALAQPGDCDEDGATSTYNQNGLIVPFDNLCGRDIEAQLDYASSAEQRRSDCLDRCVKRAPLCYGFDYTPYISNFAVNCWLMNGTFSASNATERNYVADAAMLNPAFLDQLPENCKTLGLRGCFEQNGRLVSGTSSLATPTASSSPSISEASITTTAGDQQKASGGLSTGAKAGIGAGVALVALIAILCGTLFMLKRVKRKRTTFPSAEVQQSNYGDTHPPHKREAQIYALSSPGLATSSPANSAAIAEPVHEIDGRTRHEK